MAFIFKLRVSGICAFVPFKDSMRIVLPNARDFDHMGEPVDANTPNTSIHVPLIAVPKPFLTNKGRPPGFQFRNRTISPHVLFAFPLDGDDLDVTPVDPYYVDPPAPVSKCPTKKTETDYGWIANMEDVGVAKMWKKAKEDSLVNNKLVLARVTFAAGTCATSGFALDFHKVPKGYHIVHWTYTDPDGKELKSYERRALAEFMSADIPIETGTEVIIGPRANGIYLDNRGKNLQAFLFNLPLPDLLNESLSNKARLREEHFQHFYRIANPTVRATMMYAPVPRRKRCKKVISGLGGPKCPPAFFAD